MRTATPLGPGSAAARREESRQGRERKLERALVAGTADVQAAIWRHPWVRSFLDGTLPDQAFINWVGQCGLFIAMERTALLVLRSYIQPGELDDLLVRLVEDARASRASSPSSSGSCVLRNRRNRGRRASGTARTCRSARTAAWSRG